MLFEHAHIVSPDLLPKSYNSFLVVLSVVIAVVSSFTAFGTAERALNTTLKRYQYGWILFGACSLGLGIWAMHFIGMLALDIAIAVNYDISTTVISVVPAIAASWVVFWMMNNQVSGPKKLIIGGVLLGSGVSAMHLIGMAAMRMNAQMSHDMSLLGLATGLAIVFATVALKIHSSVFTRKSEAMLTEQQVFSAVIMGTAISSMHYMAMYAVEFHPLNGEPAVAGINASILAVIVSISVLIVILFSFLIPSLLVAQYKLIARELSDSIHKSLARNIAITESAYDAWVHINDKGEVIGWNKRAEELFGWTEAEAMEQLMHKLIIPPEFQVAHTEGMTRFLATGKSSILNKVVEIEAINKSGVQFPIEITITPITTESGYEFSSFIRDISERKRIEEKQATLVRELQFEKNALDAHAIVSVTNIDGKIIYTNERFEKISQFSRAELRGKTHNLISSDEHSHQFFRMLWFTISRGKVWHGIVKNKAKDGSFYWVSLTIAPFLDQDGEPIRYVAIGTDISELKKLEVERELTQAELIKEKQIAESASKAKSEFLSSMSHELRTPLNAIIGFAQLLESDVDDPLSENQRDQLNYILNSGEHLLTLINSVLDLSQIESGQSILSLEAVRLADVIKETESLIRNMAAENGVIINISVENSNSVVCADYTKIKQVLINLVSNAIKYNQQGGWVNISYQDLDESVARIIIEDNGVGIAEDKRNRLFKAFDRLGQENSAIEGTGVGLVVTQNLVKLMGGKIGFESEQGKGTTFWVDLPLFDQVSQPE